MRQACTGSPTPTRVPRTPKLSLDLGRGEIRTIVWATGFKPDYAWLHVPVCDPRGRLRHEGGIVAAPGLYVMGLPFMRRRKSSFIHGVDDDACELSAHLAGYLADRKGRPGRPRNRNVEDANTRSMVSLCS